MKQTKGWKKENVQLSALLKGWVDKKPIRTPIPKPVYDLLEKRGVKPENMNKVMMDEFCDQHNAKQRKITIFDKIRTFYDRKRKSTYVKEEYLGKLYEYIGNLIDGKPFAEFMKNGEDEPIMFKIPREWIKVE